MSLSKLDLRHQSRSCMNLYSNQDRRNDDVNDDKVTKLDKIDDVNHLEMLLY